MKMNNLFNNGLDLIILLFFGVLFLFIYAKLKEKLLEKYNGAKNNAISIIFISSLVATSINFIHISEAASDAILFFLEKDKLFNAVLYAGIFFTTTLIFSIAIFKFSFFIVSILTKEDETDELIKNNTEIAWLHAVILVALTFIIAPALVKIAVSFIPYPDMPF
jgi:hypothetical protein